MKSGPPSPLVPSPRGAEWHALSSDDWRRLVEGVRDYAIYTLDPQGFVTSWNAGAENIKGYRAEEIVGASFERFFTPEDRAAGRPARELEMARAEGRFEEECYRVRKDGSKFWANVVLTCIRDEQGKLLGFAKITRDLTARVVAETTARELAREQIARSVAEEAESRAAESERRYRALSQRLSVILEGVADGISVQERSGRIVYANTAAARSSGFDSAEAFLSAGSEILARFEITDEQGAPLDYARLPGRRALLGESDAALVMRVRDKASGRTWWSDVRAAPVLDEAGQPELAVNIWHDVTEQRRRQEYVHHIARASAALSESLDYERMLATLGSILVPSFADWCSIRVLEGDELRQVAVTHVDPRKVEFAIEVGRRYPPDPGQQGGVWDVVRTGRASLIPQVTDEMMAKAARDAEHHAILRSLGVRSAMTVPLKAGQKTLGAMSLVAAESNRGYDQLDLALAVELGERAGQAIENARLYAAERRARAELSLLAEAGEVFASVETYDQMLERVARIALPTLGDFAFFDLDEGTTVRRTAAALDPAIEAILRQTQWSRSDRTDVNLCALSSGQSALHASIDEAWIAGVATSPGHAELLRTLALTSMITVPLHSRGALLGALTLCFGSSRRQHTSDDLKLAEELARRAAISIMQMRLFAEARETAKALEEETRVLELLNQSGRTLGSSLDLQRIVQSVTDAATQVSGAEFGAFFYTVKNAEGEAFSLYTLSGAPREAFEKFGHPRATALFGPTFRAERVIRIADVRSDPRYGQSAPHHGMPPGHLPVRSYLAVPVVARSGEVLGGLFFGHSACGVFSERSERLVVGIAAQAAMAIDNARLYEAAKRDAEERSRLLQAERAARAEVERVSLMKDEFLATLSHELRTPLNAILGWSQLLLGRNKVGELRAGLETVVRNARAQAHLIEDLLDMSRIVSGKLRLDVQPTDVAAVIMSAVEAVRPSAESKAMGLRTILDPLAGPVLADPGRLQQVVWNLLNNAIKFTPKDGKVDVTLERVNSHVEISVRDNGIGVRADFLPHVFERFRQADGTTTRAFGGLGLGLAIVKQLVELHGGTVRVASDGEGRGALFVVSLPLIAVRADLNREHPTGRFLVRGEPRPLDLSGIKVLVVDDESDARELVRAVLVESKAEVFTASSAAEGLRQLAVHKPHVILSDIGMPDQDGYRFIRQVRALPPEQGGRTPAAAMTAFARSEDRTRAMLEGFQIHVAKPIEPSELLATVASMAHRTRPAPT
jgi:PAS domain S-box-containing protein